MFGPEQNILFQPLTKTSSTDLGGVGRTYTDSEGNSYRYCKAGASALSAGKVGVAPSAVANHINKAPAADVAVGSRRVSITVGATAVTEDQYAGGFLAVNDGTGEGTFYRVIGNSSCDASGTTVVILDDPIRVALTNAGSEVSLIPSPYNGVVESTDEENVPVGVPLCAVPAANYYWAQTEGVHPAVLVIGTPAVGSILTLGATAGSLTTVSTTIATTVTQPIVGTMFATAGVTTEYKPVLLDIC